MYISNNGVDFWVVRRTWRNAVARVTHVTPLDNHARAPYYGNPEVKMDLYTYDTGQLREENISLSCPGTSSYCEFDTETWPAMPKVNSIPLLEPDPIFRKRLIASQKQAARKQRKEAQRDAKPRFYFVSNPLFLREKNRLFSRDFYVRWDKEKRLWWCLQDDLTTQNMLRSFGCELTEIN